MIKRIPVILSVFFLLTLNLVAQEEQGYLEVKGTVRSDRRAVANAKIKIYRNSVKIKTLETGENGRFSFKLDLNKSYIVQYKKEGLVSKKVSFNTEVPKDEIGIWTYKFSIDLFPMVEDLDITILKNPIAKIKYNDSYGEFDFDEEYTDAMLKKINILLSQYDDLKQKAYDKTIDKADSLFDKKEYDKAYKLYDLAIDYDPYEEYPDEMMGQIKRIISKQEAQKKSYNKTIALADKNFNIENFKSAKTYYKKALTYQPDEEYPKSKISEIDKILGNLQANIDKKAADEKAYKSYIATADKSFDQKQYSVAKDNYNKALEIKPNEKYPLFKLQELEKLIADQQNLEALNAQKLKEYNEAIKQADLNFNNKKYADAKTNYRKALTIKPKEQYPQDKINDINNILDKAKSVDEQYNKTIQFADNDFGLKQYDKAKQNYQKASLLKPDQEYPKNKIAEINNMLLSLKEKEKSYNQTITQADAAFNQKQYQNSKLLYNKALTFKPNEQYPTNQLLEIDKILAQQATLDKSYQTTIASADQAFNNKNYQSSLRLYQKALGIKPNEQYPQNRITEVNKLLAVIEANDKQYNQAIAKADKLYRSSKFDEAKIIYRQSLTYKPDEQYPKTKLADIEQKLASLRSAAEQQKANELAYKEAITKGDQLFTSEKFSESRIEYEKALTIKPNEKYPKNKINEIIKKLAELDKITKKYNQVIATADGEFNIQKFADAKKDYQKSLEIKPNEQYPKDKITAIEQILLTQQKKAQDKIKLEADYKDYITKADASFNSKKYADAKNLYQSALLLKPNEQYPTNQLLEIDKIMAQQATLDKSYRTTIASADQAFNNKNYQSSLGLYQKALGIKPNEQYPQNRITEVNKLLAVIEANDKQYNQAIAKADKLYRSSKFDEAKIIYQQSLTYKPDEQYPKTKLADIEQKLASLRSAAEQQKANELAYKEAITKGDQLFTSEKFSESRTEYEKALTIKPNEKYPKNKINEIIKKLAELDKITKKYNQVIATADGEFNIQKFAEAKKDYQKSLEIKPEEQYPKDKITAIEQILLTQQKKAQDKIKLEADYKDYITKADALFNSKKYADAKNLYQSALLLKPNEQYPTNQLLEIDKILAQQNALDKSYQTTIASADQAFNNKNYQSSLGLYQKALGIKPNEQYPKQKIDEINNILTNIQNNKNEYAKIIKEADGLYYSKKYKEAKQQYEKALTVLPNEKYPKNKISELKELIASMEREEKSRQALQKQYDEIISNADKFFDSKNYDDANDLYNQALSILPKEQYPKKKINDIKNILANLRNEKIASYNATVTKADGYFKDENFDEAKSLYNKALNLFPNKEYPKNQLTEITKILEQKEYERQQQLLTDKKYQDAIKEADKYFNSTDYASAKAKYKLALTIKPKQNYPQDRIDKIDKLIQLQKKENLAAAQKERQQKIDAAKAENAKNKDFDFTGKVRGAKFLSDLARKYPEGVTVENYNKPHKKIKRVIVNRNGIAKEYIQVKYSYGIYYFRNGRNISRYIFLAETKE